MKLKIWPHPTAIRPWFRIDHDDGRCIISGSVSLRDIPLLVAFVMGNLDRGTKVG